MVPSPLSGNGERTEGSLAGFPNYFSCEGVVQPRCPSLTGDFILPKFREQDFATGARMQHIIDKRLQDLACPVSLFVPIADLIGRTRLTQFLQGAAQLDSNLVEKLVAVLDELIELKRVSVIAPDWGDAENIREQLRRRREIKTAIKYDENRIRELLQVQDGAGN
jgi:hypothetical protein